MQYLRSIRSRLLVSLMSAVALAALITGAVSYRSILHESETLFDYQLQQMALSLRDQGAISAAQANVLQDSRFDFVVQIWSFDGELVYASRRDADLPPRALIGFAEVQGPNTKWRVFSTVSSTPFGDRVIQVAQPLRIRQTLAAAAALRSALPLLAAGPLLALAVWAIVAASLKPLQRVAAEVRRRDANSLAPIAEQDLPQLPAEVEPLVQALNTLLAQVDSAFRSQRDFVADAAHELRSPLTALKLQLKLLEQADRAAPEQRADALAELKRGIDRATRLVEQLLALARSEVMSAPLKPEPLDLAELARRAVADTVALAVAKGVNIELEAAAAAPLHGEPQALYTAARNLADNAVRYTPAGGRVRVSVAAAADGSAELIVDDSGPGIPAADRERVFDRFYRRLDTAAPADTGDAAQQGSGLGLAIVRGVAQRHGATLALSDSPLGGLRATLHLPAAGKPS